MRKLKIFSLLLVIGLILSFSAVNLAKAADLSLPPVGSAEGMSGLDVLNMQRLLSAAGLYSGALDGIWGKLTTAAVKAFNLDLGVSSTSLTAQTLTQLRSATLQLVEPTTITAPTTITSPTRTAGTTASPLPGQTGLLTIIKDSVPNNPQDFKFDVVCLTEVYPVSWTTIIS